MCRKTLAHSRMEVSWKLTNGSQVRVLHCACTREPCRPRHVNMLTALLGPAYLISCPACKTLMVKLSCKSGCKRRQSSVVVHSRVNHRSGSQCTSTTFCPDARAAFKPLVCRTGIRASSHCSPQVMTGKHLRQCKNDSDNNSCDKVASIATTSGFTAGRWLLQSLPISKQNHTSPATGPECGKGPLSTADCS